MTTLTLETAECMARAAITNARAHGRAPMGVAVIDGSGTLKFGLREDGSNLAAIEIATGKARAALTFGCTSKQIADALSGNPLAGPSILSAVPGPIVLLAGGVIIRTAGGVTIGAIGVAGGAPDDDELVAMAGAAG